MALLCSGCQTVVTEKDPEYASIASSVTTYAKAHHSDVTEVHVGWIKKTSTSATAHYAIDQPPEAQVSSWPLKSTLIKSNAVWVVTGATDDRPFLIRFFGLK